MLEIIALILVVGWLMGSLASYPLGGLIHVLPVLLIFLILLHIFAGKPPL